MQADSKSYTKDSMKKFSFILPDARSFGGGIDETIKSSLVRI